jgi:hypothetical protein
MPTKKSTTKKAPAKKKTTVTSKKASSSAKTSVLSGVTLRKEQEDFMTFRITRETIYWMILGLVVILFTIWLMRLQADIQSLYDQIDLNTASSLVE